MDGVEYGLLGHPQVVLVGVGWLVAERDEAGFATAIARALAETEHLPAMGARARAVAEDRLDNAKLLEKLETEMRRLA